MAQTKAQQQHAEPPPPWPPAMSRAEINARRRAHYAANNAAYAERNRARYAANRTTRLADSAVYRAQPEHRAEALERSRAWRAERPEYMATWSRANYAANKSRILQQMELPRFRGHPDAWGQRGARCREAGIVPSMGSVGDAYDNAMAESFFATLECELIDPERFGTREEARTEIFDFLETWYNPRRWHSSLDYASPMEYERRWQETISAPSV